MWTFRITNLLPEQLVVREFGWGGARLTGFVSGGTTKTFSIAAGSAELPGELPHVHVSGERETWCSAPYVFHGQGEPNSTAIAVVVDCSAG